MSTTLTTTPAGRTFYIDSHSGAFAAIVSVGSEVSGTVIRDWTGKGWTAFVTSLDGFPVISTQVHASSRGKALDAIVDALPDLLAAVVRWAERDAHDEAMIRAEVQTLTAPLAQGRIVEEIQVAARDLQVGDDVAGVGIVADMISGWGTVTVWVEGADTDRECSAHYNHGDPVQIEREIAADVEVLTGEAAQAEIASAQDGLTERYLVTMDHSTSPSTWGVIDTTTETITPSRTGLCIEAAETLADHLNNGDVVEADRALTEDEAYTAYEQAREDTHTTERDVYAASRTGQNRELATFCYGEAMMSLARATYALRDAQEAVRQAR